MYKGLATGLIYSFFSFCLFAQSIPPSRLSNWEMAGTAGLCSEPSVEYNFVGYGGVGDSVTPNDVYFANILAMIGSGSGKIVFPPGNYLFNQTLLPGRGVWLVGAGADSTRLIFDFTSEGDCIRFEGNESPDTVLLSANASKGDSVVQAVSSGGFFPGQVVYLIDEDASLVASSWAIETTGQILRINAISGTEIVFEQKLRRNFLVSEGAYLRRLDMAGNCGIQGIGLYPKDTTLGQTSTVAFNFVSGGFVKCVKSEGCNFSHVNISSSSNIEVSGSYFKDGFDYGSGGKAYGVMVQAGSGDCLIKDNIFNHLRHSMILQSGANGNVFGYNYSLDPFWTGVALPANSAGDLVLHGNYPYRNLFEGNIGQNLVVDDSHGKNGPDNVFFRNRLESYGIFMNTGIPSDSQLFVGNEVPNTGPFLGNYSLAGTGHFQYGNFIQGSTIPPGTDSLGEASLLFGNWLPSFYLSGSSWPPIGPPNTSSTNPNHANFRFLSGMETNCSEDSLVEIPQTVLEVFRPKPIVFPNPTNGRITIQSIAEAESGILVIRLFDISGRMVQGEKEVLPETAIDFNGPGPGLYFLLWKEKDSGSWKTEKLIIL